MAVIGPNGELSVIVRRLGCESVVCFNLNYVLNSFQLRYAVVFFYFDERM